MQNRCIRPVLAVLGLVVAVGVCASSVALAKTKVAGPCNPAVGVVRHEWRFQNPTCGPVQTLCRFNNGCPFTSTNILFRMQQGTRGVLDCNNVAEPTCPNGPPLDVVAQQGGWTAAGKHWAKDLVNAHNAGALATSRGGLATEAAGDTAFAEDSMAVNVVRAGTTVTLNAIEGYLKHDSGVSGDKSALRSTFTLAVYPDVATMNADTGETGVGANFFGRVVFQQSKVILYPAGQIGGGFSAGDFTLAIGPNGTNIVRPQALLSKVVTVPSGAANAAVSLIVDPTIDGGAVVPVASPITIALLSLLLLGSGIWFVSFRTRRA